MTTQLTTQTPTAVDPEGLRSGRLGLADVVAQSVAVIAPALSGGVISYLAAVKAGGATPLSYLLATLGTLCLGGVVAGFARRLPSAGSLYTYTCAGLNQLTGFVVGAVYMLTALVIGAGILAGSGYFASTLLGDLTDRGGTPPVSWVWFFAAGLVLLVVLSVFDVRISTRAQLLFAAASMAIMLLAAAIVIGRGSPTGSANPGAHLDLGAFWPHAAGVPVSGVAFGLAFGVLSFAGFETGAVLAEETAAPKRNIPRAVLGSVAVTGVFFVVVTYATAIGFGVRDAKTGWPGAAAGLVAVTPYQWLGDLVLFAIAVSCLFCSLGVVTAVSRVCYAMGREAVLPCLLGRIHPRLRTPVPAILTAVALMAAAVPVCLVALSSGSQAAIAGVGPDGADRNTPGLAAFSYLVGLGTPAFMLCYLVLAVAGLRAGRAARATGFAALGALGAIVGGVAVYGSLYYSFVGGALFVNRMIPVLVAAAVLAVLVAGVALRAIRPTAWAAMGGVFEE